MTPQGYPLWAVESDGTAYAVVAWDENGYPLLIPLQHYGERATSGADDQTFTFTTTDPTERPDINAVYAAGEDLRARMAALADEIGTWTGLPGVGLAAARIRRELAR